MTRNRPASLERCLQSWRKQTVQPDEIVVSDDSDLEQAKEIERLAARYGCVYTRGPHRGLYANRNHASLTCRGTHVLSADDDHSHPTDYVATVMDLITIDPSRVWIFFERPPGNTELPLVCPAELHRSGHGCAPADPSRCAAIADGSTVYPRAVFDQGLRYDEAYPFGALWYAWGKLLASRGWHITFSDRTFVWHHYYPDGIVPDDGRATDRAQVQRQLLTTTYVQFVDAFWLERSPVRVFWAVAYLIRRLILPDSAVNYRVSTRLPLRGALQAVSRAWSARCRYVISKGGFATVLRPEPGRSR